MSDNKLVDDDYINKFIEIKNSAQQRIPKKVVRTYVPRYALLYDCSNCKKSIYSISLVDNTEKMKLLKKRKKRKNL
jgi:hypothetical protein